jgi:hypothetical protein
MGDKKAPGEDRITGEIYKCTFEMLPDYIAALYNGCLRRGVFPTRWKRAKLIPIAKPGKENRDDVTKFRDGSEEIRHGRPNSRRSNSFNKPRCTGCIQCVLLA